MRKIFVICVLSLIGYSAQAKEQLNCRVYASILKDGKMVTRQVWGDLGSSPMTWDLAYNGKTRVFSFAAEAEGSRITARINFHVSGLTTAVGESQDGKVITKLENDRLYLWAENLGLEMEEGDKFPNVKSVELRCKVD